MIHRFLALLLMVAFLFSLMSAPAHAAGSREGKPHGRTAVRAPASNTYRSALAALENGRAAPARDMLARGRDPVLNKVLSGLLMAEPNNSYTFGEMASFISENPDWPGQKGIVMILERKIPEDMAPEQLVNWFNAHEPLTPAGFERYIDALMALGHATQAREKVKARWIERDFPSGDDAVFYQRYDSLLGADDHRARLDRLLWDDEIVAARAMYSYVGDDHKALAEARIALAHQTKGAQALLAQVPSFLQADPGLLFERMRWRRKNDDDEGALSILFNPPESWGRADFWWRESHILLRRLMERKEYESAYRVASSHGMKTGFDFVQAEFTAGWLALRFLNRTDLAYKHFAALLQEANTPISRSRGAYWLGRTYEAAGQGDDARQAYETAAVLNTTYYGQLAIARLSDRPVIHAASEPPVPHDMRTGFFNRDVVRATEALYKLGEVERARVFFKAVIDGAVKRIDYALALELAYQLQRPDWAVTAAKAANQKNFIITGASYPVLAMDIPRPPELALTHALIRQESQFKSDAGSPVGAQGLMQLMPATAKEVAKKIGVGYNAARLTDPDYNVRLGTRFIQDQIDAFDGSYILALAGYNAGPRRAREWIEAFGDPRKPDVDPVDWIEMIPIYETRNYVQRIIENLQFYRARLNKSRAPLSILQDLKR